MVCTDCLVWSGFFHGRQLTCHMNCRRTCHMNCRRTCHMNCRRACHMNSRRACHMNSRLACHMNSRRDCYMNSRRACHMNSRRACHMNSRRACHMNSRQVWVSHRRRLAWVSRGRRRWYRRERRRTWGDCGQRTRSHRTPTPNICWLGWDDERWLLGHGGNTNWNKQKKKTNKTKWQICVIFFIWPKKNVMHTFFFGVWWRYLIPFKSYSYLSKIDPASFKSFFVPLQTWVEISTFYI